jgi:hypothetical protein
MPPPSAQQTPSPAQARSLLADIAEAPDASFPRRETIVGWLNAYLQRSERPGYEMDPADASDLVALEKFLRSQRVPVATRPAA